MSRFWLCVKYIAALPDTGNMINGETPLMKGTVSVPSLSILNSGCESACMTSFAVALYTLCSSSRQESLMVFDY